MRVVSVPLTLKQQQQQQSKYFYKDTNVKGTYRCLKTTYDILINTVIMT